MAISSSPAIIIVVAFPMAVPFAIQPFAIVVSPLIDNSAFPFPFHGTWGRFCPVDWMPPSRIRAPRVLVYIRFWLVGSRWARVCRVMGIARGSDLIPTNCVQQKRNQDHSGLSRSGVHIVWVGMD